MKKKIAYFTLLVVASSTAFLFGKSQAKTETKNIEIIPENYIALEKCIPLEDIACYFIDGYGYPCFELKDVGNQLDNPNNKSYAKIMQGLEDITEEYMNNYISKGRINKCQ